MAWRFWRPRWIAALLAVIAMAAGGPDRTLARGLDLPADTTVMRDLAYGPAAAQRLDVYLPGGVKAAPVIFMVHGGAWAFGDKANTKVVENKAAHWLPRGYILVSVNNRLLPEADPLGQADDIGRALAFVQANAPAWGGDAGRLVLMGHSAGAHLVALVSADQAIATRHGAKPWLGTVALDSAAYDVVAIMQGRHLRLYDRAFGAAPDFWRLVSPLHRLGQAPRPLLLVCSSRRADSCPQARSFADKASALGGLATVLPVAMTHAAINEDLGLQTPYTEQVDGFLRSLGLP